MSAAKHRGAFGGEPVWAFVCLILSVAAVRLVASVPENGLPQFATGGDVLSVVFGDAKETISTAMSVKANEYFHGGVEADCDHLGEHCHGHDLDDDGDHDHDHDDGDEHEHEHHHHHHHHGEEPESGAHDPWAWINRHVRAPVVERHLEGEKAIELMPFYWAAVKANPRNVAAWTDAWHVSYNIMGDRNLARRILAQARAANPSNLEIEFCDARTVYDKGNGDVAKAREMFEHARKIALENCAGDVSGLSDSDRHLYRFVLTYLDKCEKTLNSAK